MPRRWNANRARADVKRSRTHTIAARAAASRTTAVGRPRPARRVRVSPDTRVTETADVGPAVVVLRGDVGSVLARVRTEDGVHDVSQHGQRWACSCAASDECRHVRRVQRNVRAVAS